MQGQMGGRAESMDEIRKETKGNKTKQNKHQLGRLVEALWGREAIGARKGMGPKCVR